MIAFGAFASTGSAGSIAPKTHNQEVNSAVNHAKIGNQTSPTSVSQEVKIEKDRPNPKSKEKRHIFAKIVLGLSGTFVIVVLVIWSIYGGPEFKY